jgi:phage shock protein A
MFKTVVTLLRGRAFEAEERLVDRHALSLLDQQMRDSALAIDRARKALALAIAQDRTETGRTEAARARIAELEGRAIAALEAGRDDLAGKTAEAIAALEADVQASERARSLFADEIGRLESYIQRHTARFADVERGRRLARAAEAVRVARRGRLEPPSFPQSTLTEAEATLSRLREQQAEACAAETALDDLDAGTRVGDLNDRLADEGFGPPTRPRAADVLARLKERAGAPR